MWWKKDSEDTLEWTVGEAGFEDTPEAEAPLAPTTPDTPAPAPRQPLHIRWRPTALLVVLPAALILLGVWAWSQWNHWQIRREVEQVLSAERTEPPSPLGYLKWDETEPARLGKVVQLDVDTLRADAVYTFSAPDGKKYRFATPRFFRRAGESWQPADPPTSFPGELRQLTNPRLTLYYQAADAELIEQTLLPYLNATLERICARWRCAKPATLLLTETDGSRRVPADIRLEANEPLLFWLLAAADAQAPGERIRVAAPHAAGYPVDAVSTELWQRTLALQVFSQLAFAEVFAGAPVNDLLDRPFFQTFLSLEAVNYGLEPSDVREYGVAMEAARPFWRLMEHARYSSGRGGGAVTQRRDLLTLLNRFTRQWPEAEPFDFTRDAWFAGFGPGPMNWLLRRSLRDGQPFAEWVNRWRELLGQPTGAVGIPSSDLALNCFSGPQFYQAGELKPLLPFEGLPEVAFSLAGWSPTGQYLALGIGFRASVLDTQTGLIHLPTDDTGEAFHLPLAWASDAVLAYLALEVRALPQPDPDDLQLRFFDVAEPARRLPPVNEVGFSLHAGTPIYFPSPDRQWATLYGIRNIEGSPQLALEVLPALGGQRRLLTRNVQPPAWSPDSRELAFLDWEASTSSWVLRVYTVSTGQTRVVWKSQALGQAALQTQLAWSPDGRWIALAAHPADGNSLHWFGLVASDGSETVRLDTPRATAGAEGSGLSGGVIRALAFSHDGRYLALSGAFSEPQLLIYEVAAGRLVRTLPGGEWPWLQWSPDDRQLLLSGNGVALLEEPLNAQSQPRLLANGQSCFSGSWKP
jgi:hypothetical protein